MEVLCKTVCYNIYFSNSQPIFSLWTASLYVCMHACMLSSEKGRHAPSLQGAIRRFFPLPQPLCNLSQVRRRKEGDVFENIFISPSLQHTCMSLEKGWGGVKAKVYELLGETFQTPSWEPLTCLSHASDSADSSNNI